MNSTLRRLWILFFAAPAALALEISSPSGVRASLDGQGHYEVSGPGAKRQFTGVLGAVPLGVEIRRGHDASLDENFEEIFFHAPGGEYAIRLTEKSAVAFFSIKTTAARKSALAFPVFDKYPTDARRMGFDGNFAVYSFKRPGDDGPWLFFNEPHDAAVVLSPAANYMVARTRLNSSAKLESYFDNGVRSFPAGFEHRVILAFAEGPNRAFDLWGSALRRLEGKSMPAQDADAGLERLGYWTDRGGTYYYDYEQNLGYRGTLLAMRDEFRAKGVQLGYVQLDSWWYPKGPFKTWKKIAILDGMHTLTPAPELFPNGLAGFRAELGLPLVVHARWLDSNSPYRREYEVSGKVSIDPRFWEKIMRDLAAGGVMTFEQDWLSKDAQTEWNLTAPKAFMGEMALAAERHGLSLQYCMALPRHYLEGLRHPNQRTIRTSNDRFESTKWNEFLFGSRLASSVGAWPWSDVFMSGETGNLMISALSGGMLGVGDPLGAVSAANLLRAARPDGVLVKPDLPLVPLDSVYAAFAKDVKSPMIAATANRFADGSRVDYVVAYSLSHEATLSLDPATLPGAGSFASGVYAWSAGQGRELAPGEALPIKAGKEPSLTLFAPVGPAGIAFLGDLSKFASAGRRRVVNLRQDAEGAEVTLEFGEGEEFVEITAYASRELRASVLGAAESADAQLESSAPLGLTTQYDPATKLTRVRVGAPSNGKFARVILR